MFYIKALLALIWFVICSLLAIFMCFFRWRNPDNSQIFAHLFTKYLPLITGVKVAVKNQEAIAHNQPCIYLANHQSNLDLCIQATCYPKRTVVIGKKELIWIPFFGFLFYGSGHILIDRKTMIKPWIVCAKQPTL